MGSFCQTPGGSSKGIFFFFFQGGEQPFWKILLLAQMRIFLSLGLLSREKMLSKAVIISSEDIFIDPYHTSRERKYEEALDDAIDVF